MKKETYFLLILYISSTFLSFGQNQANVWLFGEGAGLDFNYVTPSIIRNYQYYTGRASSVMCDTTGKLLFSTNGVVIWDSTFSIMQNGDNIDGDLRASQGALIVSKPKSDHIFYLFTVASCYTPKGMRYSVIDMNLNGGLGAVTSEKNVNLPETWDAVEKLTACKHANGEDIWIISRKYTDDAYISFRLTSYGVASNPVISPTINQDLYDSFGNMKISPDKKYIVTPSMNGNNLYEKKCEICRFDDDSGEITFMYSVIEKNSHGGEMEPWSAEFSPDSKLLYLGFHNGGSNDYFKLYQYDMQYIEDSALFAQSSVKVSDSAGNSLQLARDGKIYSTGPEYGVSDYLSVINKPWKKGEDCDVQENAIYFGDNVVGEFLPNILLDYLYRFEWEGECSGPDNAVTFKSNFMFPDSIHWNFNDPGSGADSISHQINPTHIFSSGGQYEVVADVWYPPDASNPFGRYEHTSRVVTIKQSPLPDLGPDTLICKDGEIELNGGAGQGSYVWSTGDFGMNDSLVTVSDTDIVWVKVNAANGCTTVDSVRVGLQPPVQFIEDNLVITPTSCGGSTGSITGIELSGVEPFTVQWQDASGNVLSSAMDISGLGVGNYFLSVTDGNGCNTLSDSYTITDAGDIAVDTVLVTGAHCGQHNGEIAVKAHSEATTYFRYSIDNGVTFQENDTLFTGLYAGSYVVKVNDTNGCSTVYKHNPVIVNNIPAPEVTLVTVTDETNYDANGEIHITATGAGVLSFSNNGTDFQLSGDFINLSAGTYTCVIKDDYGCDTTFEVKVNRLSTTFIEALAGDGHSCLGDAAVVPLSVDGFSDIVSFRSLLFYDSSVMQCIGYQDANPALENNLQVQSVNNTNRIIITWQNSSPVSLSGNTDMVKLIFTGKREGFSQVDWAHAAGESFFTDADGHQVNTQYGVGNVRIFSRPAILLASEQKVCEGEDVMISPFVSGGSGEYDVLWQGPDNYTSTQTLLWINSISASKGGTYTFTVTDTINCVEHKSINVIVNSGPLTTLASYDTLFVSQGDLLEAGVDAVSYLWSTGDTTAAIKLDTMGLYTLQTQSANGCKSFDTVQILWGGIPFFVPDAFTPNGDGLNDDFRVIPRYDYVRSFKLQIYNRWGALIFETTGSNNGWDGTFKGKMVEQGIYVYRIVYTDFQTRQSKMVQGTVLLVK